MNSTKPVLTVMVGLPGSGKSTLSYRLAQETNTVIFSSDELRKEMFGDTEDQNHNADVFNELHKRIKHCLNNGGNAIYDACNISSKRRRAFLSELKKIDCVKKCVIAATPYEQCLKNNKNRDRQVPEYAIDNMYKHWNTPYWFEGWDDIQVCYWDDERKNPTDWCIEYMPYKQDNPHHVHTLGNHCVEAALYGFRNFGRLVGYAAMIHDNGKPFVKKFENYKGKPDDVAHFYNHENCGAYNTLFFDIDKEILLDVSILVNLHMHPYNWEREQGAKREKLCNKYKKLWGDKLYNDVLALHEADKTAH